MPVASELSPSRLSQEAYKLLARDRARLATLNYPVYKGSKLPPMSSLSQRAEDLRKYYTGRPAPYGAKIESVLGRKGEGLSNPQIEQLLGRIGEEQRSFGREFLSPLVQKQFGSSYTAPRAAEFSERLNRDIGSFLPQAHGTLRDTALASNTLEKTRDQQIAATLQNLQRNAQERRRALISNLEQFGAQKHGHSNLINAAQRSQFERELEEPHRKMQLLAEALGKSGLQGKEGEEMEPSLAKSNAQEILQALRAYGVDLNQPTEQWESTKLGRSGYPGKLVAGLPQEVVASGEILERLAPSLKSSNSPLRKQLVQDLSTSNNITTRALEGLNPAVQGAINQLENQAKERVKRDLAAINNKYVKLGQYGSSQHMAEVERRSKDLNKAVLEQREKLIQDNLRKQLSEHHQNEIAKIGQLGKLGNQSQMDYFNFLNEIRGSNQAGAQKFANEQEENEDLYRNYQNERLWEWPHMRNMARREGVREGVREGGSQAYGDIFRGLQSQGISLGDLAKLNANYSNLEKERNQYRSELSSLQEARAELQRQLGQAQAAEKTRAQAMESQRQAALRQQQQQAQADAERQRLAKAAEKQALYQRLLQAERPYRELQQKYQSERDAIFSQIGPTRLAEEAAARVFASRQAELGRERNRELEEAHSLYQQYLARNHGSGKYQGKYQGPMAPAILEKYNRLEEEAQAPYTRASQEHARIYEMHRNPPPKPLALINAERLYDDLHRQYFSM